MPFNIQPLPNLYKSVVNSFLNPYVSILALNGEDILAATGPKSKQFSVIWVDSFVDNVYTFDIQNSIVVLVSVKGV